jgi:hypothetical protein
MDLPADVTQEERHLLGPALYPGGEYQRALLRSAYRQELLLGEILAELRARPATPAEGQAATKPRKPPTS